MAYYTIKSETELYWEKRNADMARFTRLLDSGAAGNAEDAIAACLMYSQDSSLIYSAAIG